MIFNFRLGLLGRRRLYFILFSSALYLSLWTHYTDKALLLSFFWSSLLFHLRGQIAFFGVLLSLLCAAYYRVESSQMLLFLALIAWQRWSEPMMYLSWQRSELRLIMILAPLILLLGAFLQHFDLILIYLYTAFVGQFFAGYLNRHLPEGLKTHQKDYLKDIALFILAFFCSQTLIVLLLAHRTAELLFYEITLKDQIYKFLRYFLLHCYTLSMPLFNTGIHGALVFLCLPLCLFILGGFPCTQTLPMGSSVQAS